LTTLTQPITIPFRLLSLEDKPLYDGYLASESGLGCEYSFANRYLWGKQQIAVIHGQLLIFSEFGSHMMYAYPLGTGDKAPALEAIVADAKARGIVCRITGIPPKEKCVLERLYPEEVRFRYDEGTFDYVYDVNDLADLKGKKFHGKRNHLNRFSEEHPNHKIEPLCRENLALARSLVKDWYSARASENSNSYRLEIDAIEKAFLYQDQLALEGLLLTENGTALALTIGSRLSHDTFDVQFEKARAEVNGAYTAINCAFARYIREKYPEVRFLDREEDMGIEGLRKAKRSYRPHHMVEKYQAYLLEHTYDR